MRFKSKVLAQLPNAKPVVLRRFPDMEPKYVAIFNGPNGRVPMDDGYDPAEHDSGWGGEKQLANAAWRSAYFWLLKNKGRAEEAA
jgi:hypothetical protein